MIKKHLITTVIIGVAILFVSAAIYAKSAPDVIPLKDPAYKTHKKELSSSNTKNTGTITPRRIRNFTPANAESVTTMIKANHLPS